MNPSQGYRVGKCLLWVGLICGLVTSTGCMAPQTQPSESVAQAPVDLDFEKNQLLEADRKFSVDTGEQGTDGWLSHFAEDGMMLSEGTAEPIQGKEAIRTRMEPFFAQAGNSLTWEPHTAQVSGSADLGFTIGRYETITVNDEGDPLRSKGKYVTIWRKQPDGQWKVIVDIGNED